MLTRHTFSRIIIFEVVASVGTAGTFYMDRYMLSAIFQTVLHEISEHGIQESIIAGHLEVRRKHILDIASPGVYSRTELFEHLLDKQTQIDLLAGYPRRSLLNLGYKGNVTYKVRKPYRLYIGPVYKSPPAFIRQVDRVSRYPLMLLTGVFSSWAILLVICCFISRYFSLSRSIRE